MFFERYYPGAAHIADPVLKLYQAFRVRRAKPWYFLDLGSARRFWELLRRGHRNDRPAADPWVLHATLLFYHGNLIWTHYAKTPGVFTLAQYKLPSKALIRRNTSGKYL